MLCPDKKYFHVLSARLIVIICLMALIVAIGQFPIYGESTGADKKIPSEDIVNVDNEKSLSRDSDPENTDTVSVEENERASETFELLPIVFQPDYSINLTLPKHKMFRCGDPSKKQIALTFDDGPHSKTTEQILNILDKCDIKATFFFVGSMMVQYPYLVKKTYEKGHCIGNHTYTHKNLTNLTEREIYEEVEIYNNLIWGFTGKKPNFLRVPGGNYNDTVINVSNNLGLSLAFWTINSYDYMQQGRQRTLNIILSKVSNGAIILLHDGPVETIEVLPDIISMLKEKGYQCVTLDELTLKE